MDEFNAAKSDVNPEATVADQHAAMVAKIGENLTIRRFEKVTGDVVVSYIHMGGKIGVLVDAKCDAPNDNIKEAMKNVAMQIAAMNPQFVKDEDMTADFMAKEKDTIVDSSLNDTASLPKPILNELLNKAVSEKLWNDEDIAAYEAEKNNKFLFNFLSDEAKAVLASEAMAKKAEYVENKIFAGLVDGRLKKHFKEICLMDQTYVKAEDKESVKQYVEKVAKENGCTFEINKFIRFETGEGLEKKNEDFAAEVAKQMGQ